jgi:hypothetical protein
MYVNLSRDEDAIDVIRIDSDDTWDMDNRLARIVLPMLKQFRRHVHEPYGGYPSELNKRNLAAFEPQMAFSFIDANAEFEAAETIAAETWKAHVDAMIWSFQQIVDDPNHSHPPARFNGDYRAYHAEVRRGLLLFGEFYQSLWE